MIIPDGFSSLGSGESNNLTTYDGDEEQDDDLEDLSVER